MPSFKYYQLKIHAVVAKQIFWFKKFCIKKFVIWLKYLSVIKPEFSTKLHIGLHSCAFNFSKYTFIFDTTNTVYQNADRELHHNHSVKVIPSGKKPKPLSLQLDWQNPSSGPTDCVVSVHHTPKRIYVSEKQKAFWIILFDLGSLWQSIILEKQ